MINIFVPGCRFGRIPFDSLMEDHMKYMVLIYDDEKGWAKLSETERQQAMGGYMQFTQQSSPAASMWPALSCTRLRRQPASGYATANGL